MARGLSEAQFAARRSRARQRQRKAQRRKGRGPRGGTAPRNPLLSQAQTEAQIVYGPQIRGLAELIREAKAGYQGELRGADVASAGIIKAIDQSRPTLAAGYQRSRDAFGIAQSNIDAGLRGLGAGADAFKAAATAEHQAAERDLAESARRADADLVSQRSNAAAGRVYQRSAARDRYETKMDKYRASRIGLYQDVGTYTIKALHDLQDAKAKADQQRRDYRLKVADLRRKIADDATDAQLRREGYAIQREAEAGRNRRAAMKGSGRSGSRGGLTPSKVLSYREAWRLAVDAVESNPTDSKGRRHSASWYYKQARAPGSNVKNMPPRLLRAAIITGIHGGTLPREARWIRKNYGIRVPTR